MNGLKGIHERLPDGALSVCSALLDQSFQDCWLLLVISYILYNVSYYCLWYVSIFRAVSYACSPSAFLRSGILLLFLSVVGVWTMLAAEVLFYEQWIHCRFRVYGVRNESHLCHLFHHYSVIDRVVCILAP